MLNPPFISQKHIDEKTLDLRLGEHRQFILQIALKCADISNPTRPWDISHKWSLKVCDEFFRQGEFERQLGLPVTSICDQQSTSVAKIQVGKYFGLDSRYLHKHLQTINKKFCFGQGILISVKGGNNKSGLQLVLSVTSIHKGKKSVTKTIFCWCFFRVQLILLLWDFCERNE